MFWPLKKPELYEVLVGLIGLSQTPKLTLYWSISPTQSKLKITKCFLVYIQKSFAILFSSLIFSNSEWFHFLFFFSSCFMMTCSSYNKDLFPLTNCLWSCPNNPHPSVLDLAYTHLYAVLIKLYSDFFCVFWVLSNSINIKTIYVYDTTVSIQTICLISTTLALYGREISTWPFTHYLISL